MAQLPPNKASEHRKQNSKSNWTSSNKSGNTERVVGRFYSSNSLAESNHEEREMDRASRSSTCGMTSENCHDNS